MFSRAHAYNTRLTPLGDYLVVLAEGNGKRLKSLHSLTIFSMDFGQPDNIEVRVPADLCVYSQSAFQNRLIFKGKKGTNNSKNFLDPNSFV